MRRDLWTSHKPKQWKGWVMNFDSAENLFACFLDTWSRPWCISGHKSWLGFSEALFGLESNFELVWRDVEWFWNLMSTQLNRFSICGFFYYHKIIFTAVHEETIKIIFKFNYILLFRHISVTNLARVLTLLTIQPFKREPVNMVCDYFAASYWSYQSLNHRREPQRRIHSALRTWK